MSRKFGETVEDLIGWAADSEPAEEISHTQLVRWHRAGLLPRPKRRGLGRGKGTETYYPPGTWKQLEALLRAKREDRRLREIAWRMWLEGFPVEEFIRSDFTSSAEAFMEDLRSALDRFDSAEDQDSGPNFANPIHQASGHPLASSGARLLLELLAGRSPLDSLPEPSDGPLGDLVQRARERDAVDRDIVANFVVQEALEEARVDLTQPLDREDTRAVVRFIAEALNPSLWAGFAASLGDEELRSQKDRSLGLQKAWGEPSVEAVRRTLILSLMFGRFGIDLVQVLRLAEQIPMFEFVPELIREFTRTGRVSKRRKRRRLDFGKMTEEQDSEGHT